MTTYQIHGDLHPDVAEQLSKHPAYKELLRRYKEARSAWASNRNVREAAATIGMTEIEYCNAMIALNAETIRWTSTATSYPGPLKQEHYYLAFREAATLPARAGEEAS